MKTLPADNLQQVGQDILRRFQNDQLYVSRFAPVAYLLDYVRRQYIYVDEACFDLFGFTARQFIEEGLEGYLSKLHPSDYQIMNRHIFPRSISFLQDVPEEKYQDFVFSFNYRTLNARGDYITVLQRSSYIPGTLPGKPLGNLGVTVDITHYKTDPSVVYTIEEVKQHNGRLYNELLCKETYPVNDQLLISRRELEILKWMAEGFSSKQIAQSLGISLNTVNNHRKNMLHRTGCRTATELLTYALRHGYL
jgi:DNA-binding CsgD family transcriptional regulator